MTPTNAQRSERAYRLLLIYEQQHDEGEDHETAVSDLLADLMHLCDDYGIEWEEVTRRAAMHHEAESRGDDDF